MPVALPEPHFIDRDPVQILRECIEQYESESGRTLQPQQVERLLIDLFVYRETLLRIGIQEAAKQNLRKYARYPMIDLVGELMGGARLAPIPATTLLQFELEDPAVADVPIPAGTRVRSKDGKVIFATDVDTTLPEGETELADPVAATCEEAGLIGNGYAPGQLAEMVEPGLFSVTLLPSNTATTANGTAEEDTERFRERLPDIIAEFAVAGPEDAYRVHALKASTDVIDAYVESPNPVYVTMTILAKTGVPSGGLITIVENHLDNEKVIPIGDRLTVQAATAVNYVLTAALTLKKGALPEVVLPVAQKAAEEYVARKKARLGRSLVHTHITNALGKPSVEEIDGVPTVKYPELAGVHKVVITLPAETTIDPQEFANCTAINLSIAGFATEEADE